MVHKQLQIHFRWTAFLDRVETGPNAKINPIRQNILILSFNPIKRRLHKIRFNIFCNEIMYWSYLLYALNSIVWISHKSKFVHGKKVQNRKFDPERTCFFKEFVLAYWNLANRLICFILLIKVKLIRSMAYVIKTYFNLILFDLLRTLDKGAIHFQILKLQCSRHKTNKNEPKKSNILKWLYNKLYNFSI